MCKWFEIGHIDVCFRATRVFLSWLNLLVYMCISLCPEDFINVESFHNLSKLRDASACCFHSNFIRGDNVYRRDYRAVA